MCVDSHIHVLLTNIMTVAQKENVLHVGVDLHTDNNVNKVVVSQLFQRQTWYLGENNT